METNRLRQFRAVAELQNLRKAAEVLHMSHSALSKSLKVLSQQLGREILVQRGRNIEVTEEGTALLSKIDALLQSEEALLSRSAEEASIIRIASYEVFSTHLLGTCWAQYFPNESLELREMLPGNLEKSIGDGLVEFGLTYEPIPTAGIELTQMGEAEMGIYGLKRKFARLDFHDLPFVAPISPIQGSPTGAKGLDGWPESDFPRRIQCRVDMMETGLAMARAGEAVIFAADFVIRHHNKFTAKPFQLEKIESPKNLKRIRRKIYLVTRKNATEDKTRRQIAKLIRNECIGRN